MSLTLPVRFKSSRRQQTLPQVSRDSVELPSFENGREVKVLPYDVAAGMLAQKALRLAGVKVMNDQFGISEDSEARQRIHVLAETVVAIGSDTAHALDAPNGAETQIENLWQQRALQGEEAILTLLSLQHLARDRSQGFYADRAADVLSNIQAEDTRIALK